MDAPTAEALASTVYALSDLDGRGAGNPETVAAALVIAETHGLPRPVLDYLNAVRKILMLGLIPPRLYALTPTEVVNPMTGQVKIAAYAPKAPHGAAVIKATRALLLERLDGLRTAAYKALPRPADPLTTLPNGTL
jgi:hypothetical protein